MVLIDPKDVVNHATTMSGQIVENISLVRWVMRIPDQIEKSVLIVLNHIIVPKSEFQRCVVVSCSC